MTTTETTPEVTFIEHLGQEIQVQLVRGETEADKAVLWLQNLAGGIGRRVEIDSTEAKTLASRFDGVASLLGGVSKAAAAADPADAPSPALAASAGAAESELVTKLDALIGLLTPQAPPAAPPAPPESVTDRGAATAQGYPAAPPATV